VLHFVNPKYAYRTMHTDAPLTNVFAALALTIIVGLRKCVAGVHVFCVNLINYFYSNKKHRRKEHNFVSFWMSSMERGAHMTSGDTNVPKCPQVSQVIR